MKKFLTPILTMLIASGGLVNAQHTYDFTNWSQATVDNLKADSAKGADSGWSDDEKNNGTTVDNKAFWMAGDNAAIGEDGNLYANGVVIEELKGLDFTTAPSTRNLALAVDYPSTSLGNYAGGSYLWLGGSKKDYFVMHNVKAGSTIKMGVESHKPEEGRGVELYVYSNGEKGAKLLGVDGNEVAVPKEFEDQEWQVPAGASVDVMVYNTNGCHVYYIDVETGEAGETEKEALTFVATCQNSVPLAPTSGVNCKSLSWNLDDETSFSISTVDEGFRSFSNQQINISGEGYYPVYMLSTSSTASKIYSFAHTGEINKVTMYAYYNKNDETTAIYLDPEGANTEVTLNGFGMTPTAIDITDIESMKICSNGLVAVFVIEYMGVPQEEGDEGEEGDDPTDEPEGMFVANSANPTTPSSIPSSGTATKSITWEINDEGTYFTLSTQTEAFRSSTKQILVNDKYYDPIYILSTGGDADKMYSIAKSDDVTKVTMYASYNKNGAEETATIYLNPGSENETSATLYGFGGEVAEVDMTEVSSFQVCSNGFMAVFVIEYGDDTSVVEGFEVEEANAEAIYYNLQGVRVANPDKGIYVRVRGNKVDKVYVR